LLILQSSEHDDPKLTWLSRSFLSQHFSDAGKRVFNVLAQNDLVAENLDIVAVSGGARTAYVLETLVNSTDNNVSITLAKGLVNNPMLSAVEVIFYGTLPEQPQCGVPQVRTVLSISLLLNFMLRYLVTYFNLFLNLIIAASGQ